MHRLSLIFLVTCMKACCLWEFSKAQTCSAIYRRFSTEHTYCLPPNTGCNIRKSSVDPDSIRIILKAHNTYRNKVAMGQESIGQLPKAANMLQMVWDEELAAIAQKHADQCKFAHDKGEQRTTKDYTPGQNLYMKSSTGTIATADWNAAIKAWYSEVSAFDRAIIPSFNPTNFKAIGHFTQEIWATSWRVGCGYTLYKEGGNEIEMITCNYGPAGNLLNAAIYQTGEPCSGCPINSCCGNTCPNAEYPGLCKLNDENKVPQYKDDVRDNAVYFCNFQDETKCPAVSYPPPWQIYNSVAGNYVGIVLQGGQSATLNFTKSFTPDGDSCYAIYYRKGPNVAGEESANSLIQHFVNKNSGDDTPLDIEGDNYGFTKYALSAPWKGEMVTAFTFSVPAGKPTQYFELRDFTVTKGSC